MNAAADRLKDGLRDVGIDPDELRFQTLSEFVQQPTGASQIRDIDPGQSIIVAFGPPKGGKTFSITDLTMHGAHGLDWHGFRIRRRLRVAYLAGEGTRGLKVRLHAWRAGHPDVGAPADFIVLPRALSLPGRVSDVVRALRTFRPDIIVTDTLNAFFGAGSDSDTEAMTVFVSAVRQLKDELGCSVYIIHHTGHGDQTRERGSIVLRGAADVLIHIAKDGNGSGNVAFQVIEGRDLEPMESPLSLRLRPVLTDWLDEDGQPYTSCLVESSDVAVALPGRTARPLGDTQAQVMEIIRSMSKGASNGISPLLARHDVVARAKDQGIDRRRVSQAWQPLERRGLIKLTEPGAVTLVRT
jgi:hypothetical protein